MQNLGAHPPPLMIATEEDSKEDVEKDRAAQAKEGPGKPKVVPPTTDEYEWQWRVRFMLFNSIFEAH